MAAVAVGGSAYVDQRLNEVPALTNRSVVFALHKKLVSLAHVPENDSLACEPALSNQESYAVLCSLTTASNGTSSNLAGLTRKPSSSSDLTAASPLDSVAASAARW